MITVCIKIVKKIKHDDIFIENIMIFLTTTTNKLFIIHFFNDINENDFLITCALQIKSLFCQNIAQF